MKLGWQAGVLSCPLNNMKSDLLQKIGKNKILIADGKLILKKTDNSKIRLIFFDALIFGGIAYIHNSITVKSGNISIPEDFFGWLSVLFAFTAILYFVIKTIKTTVDEFRTYALVNNQSEILLNDKIFGRQSSVEVQVKESLGWKGIGASYKVCLTIDQKQKILSSGNSKTEARKVATIISEFCGVGINLKYSE
jgi:hypothetical protein